MPRPNQLLKVESHHEGMEGQVWKKTPPIEIDASGLFPNMERWMEKAKEEFEVRDPLKIDLAKTKSFQRVS